MHGPSLCCPDKDITAATCRVASLLRRYREFQLLDTEPSLLLAYKLLLLYVAAVKTTGCSSPRNLSCSPTAGLRPGRQQGDATWDAAPPGTTGCHHHYGPCSPHTPCPHPFPPQQLLLQVSFQALLLFLDFFSVVLPVAGACVLL